MITNQVYYGIVIAVLTSQAFANTICNNTYTNGIGIQCFPCEPGNIAIEDCPENFTSTKCEECKDGTYQPECVTFNETVSCRNCTVCDVYKKNCTIYKDAVCELKNGTRDSSDDSETVHWWMISVSVWLLVIGILVYIIMRILRCWRHKVKTGYERSSNYGHKNQESHRQKRYNQKTKRCSGDVVHKTNIKEYKDKPSIHNVDCIDLAPKSTKKERHIDVVRPHIEPKSNDDSSRCEIENTPLLAVRCEVKNTTPLDVELNKDERIGVSSLAEPDQTTGYMNICSKPREVNMQDSSKFSDESTDQNINNESDVDNETTPLNPKETERQIAVVYPYDEAKSIGRKKVGHIGNRLQLIIKESLQVTGDYENTEARGAEIKIKENQLCHRSEDQSLYSMDQDKGTPELEIDWMKVILQLSRSFSATRWKLFAFDLLSNCQMMVRSVHDTVGEIELESKNQHTEGWVIHAYIKVFNKWLDNVGRKNATFEHIKDAVSATIEAKEALELVLSIERNPPMKVATPLVPDNFNRLFGSNAAHSQQYMALHDDEVQGNYNYAREVSVRSRQTHRLQVAHCSYCSRYTTNEISNLQETSVQLNKTIVETNCNDNDENSIKRERIKKRKKDQSKSKTQHHKRTTTEQYIIENAKQNLLLDSIPIRQNDYNMFMNFVLDHISNECHVGKETVLSITHEEFCKAQEINTKENDTFFLVKSGKTNLFIGKEVYEDLAVYGNIARPKLLTYLKDKNIDFDSTSSERFLFIKFNGNSQMENKDDKNVSNIDAKDKASEQNFQVNDKIDPSVRVCPDMKESEEHVNIKTTLKQNPSDHSFHSEQSINDIGKNNTCIQDELYPGAASKFTEHDKKELDNKAGSGQDTMEIKEKENKKEEIKYFDWDIEMELEKIKESFFPTGDESYALPDADNVAEVLSKFVDKDLYNSP